MQSSNLYDLSLPARQANPGKRVDVDLDGFSKTNASVKALLKQLQQEGFFGEVSVKYEAGTAFYVSLHDYLLMPILPLDEFRSETDSIQ